MSATGARTKVAVLISGSGSNMVALAEAARAEDCPYEIALVLTNQPGAGGLAKAESAGIATRVIDHRDFPKDREAHERAIDAALREARIETIALAGYMRVLTPFLVEAWAGKMINIHPSILPLFPGLHTHQRALDAGMKVHGCTVHLVTAGVDEGPILGQAVVPILPGDDADALAARVLTAEHRLYARTLAAFVQGGAAATDAGQMVLS